MTGNISNDNQISHYLGQCLYGNASTCYLLAPMRPNMQSKNYQLNEVSNMRSLTTLTITWLLLNALEGGEQKEKGLLINKNVKICRIAQV